MFLSAIQEALKTKSDLKDELITLKQAGLVNLDVLERNKIVAISKKGKKFMKIFDQLLNLVNYEGIEVEVKGRKIQIKYNLTNNEKKALKMMYKLCDKSTMPISLNMLVMSLFPVENFEEKTPFVVKTLKRLEKLNFVSLGAQRANLTEKGLKVISEE